MTATTASSDLAAGTCAVCRGIGFVRADVPVGDERFGKAIPCHVCRVHTAITSRYLEQLNQLPDDLVRLGATWDTFPSQMDADAVAGLRRYVQKVIARDTSHRGAVLRGMNQVGKTGLAYCVHQELRGAGIPALFITSIELLDRLRAALFDKENPGRAEWLMDRFCQVTHLVLDDLGAEKHTATREEHLFTLLNRRTKSDTATLITTNLSGEDLLAKIGPRAYSRIGGGTFYQVTVAGAICHLTQRTLGN